MKDSNIEAVLLKYKIALKILKEKFDSIYLQFSVASENNPIEHLKYRIKSPQSIADKLRKKGYDFTSDAIEACLNDVAGVRIICSFLNDMETIKDIIRKDPQIEILQEKDYITNPKNNGYSSYHMLIRLPVNMINQKTMTNEVTYVTAEVQIRTIAMDMWASLDHKIDYKKGLALPKSMISSITNTAEISREIDKNLNQIIQTINPIPMGENLPLNPQFKDRELEILLLQYASALNIIQNRIYLISQEYDLKGKINPIEHIKTRMKSKKSICRKLAMNNKPLTIENIQNSINDIAGIRVVCSFKSDLEELITIFRTMVLADSEISILAEKDYITNPKKSGYTGYHLIVQVPVHLAYKIVYTKVEIQLRTIAMDMWASLEHKLCYQKEVEPTIRMELTRIANVISCIDNNMDSIIQESQKLIQDQNNVKCKKKIINSKN